MSPIASHRDWLWASIGAITLQVHNEYLLALTTIVLVCATITYRWLAVSENGTNKNTDPGHREGGSYTEIPWAPDGIPVLGHALAYRHDPPGFLSRMRRRCGPIFRLNLAGKKMILVCGPEEQRKLATAPESVLSLRKAVGAIGFEQTLGSKNVHTGTNIHKGIVKKIWIGGEREDGRSPADRQLSAWRTSIREAMVMELHMRGNSVDENKIDFFNLVRRVMLRATIDVFIGKEFLRDWNDYNFLQEFMGFQDKLEDVTAKVVVVPRFLALVAMLWPLQRRRERLQLAIEARLKSIFQKAKESGRDADNDDREEGFWLREVLSKKISIPDIAEYIVGLLFAGHKNPAIGAAQSYLLLREFASDEVRARCEKEAAILVSSASPIKWSHFKSSIPTLRRACLESLRLTAHSIGGIRTAQKDLDVSVNASAGSGNTVYRVPKGASVAFAHITSSLDASVWGENPDVFDSDLRRHPDEYYADDYKFTTFSNGVHKCPGRELAMIHLTTTVALLLTEYEVILPESIPPLDFERATLAQRAGPVMVTIRRSKDRS